MSSERKRLPEDVADMPPGPELAATLAGIDPSALNGHDLVSVAPAYVRMISHLQAGLLDVLHHIEHCPPGDADSPAERSEEPNRWAGTEVAAAMGWSIGKADYHLRYARQIVQRLPLVHAALATGELDYDKARTFADEVTCLDELPAQLVTAKVLADGAASLTRRNLADVLRRDVLAYDPAAAMRRRRQRQRERRVQAQPHPDGTVNLHGMNLPPDRVAAIVERLTAIARTTKRQGDGRTVDQLKADSLCDLLEGIGIGGSPPGPITNPGPTGRIDQTDDDEPGDASGGGEEPVDQAAQHGSGGEGSRPVGEAAVGQPTTAGAALPGPRQGVVHVTAPLSTLVGIADDPGELAGFGPVAADILRQVVASHLEVQWRFSAFEGGQLLEHGITQARPQSPPDHVGRDGFSAADMAFIQARDHTCRGPTQCAVPATECEIDHTVAKVDGGGHHRDNGGPLCKREHMFKHQSGARLEQPEPGVFHWTTPLGHRYVVRPQPYEESTGPPETTTEPGAARRRLRRILRRVPATSRRSG